MEVGSFLGGGLYAWGATGAQVFSVTLGEPRDVLARHGAHVIWGDSHDPEVQWMLAANLAGRRPDFMFIDGDHTTDGARADWEFAVKTGARLVGFHDIAHRIHGPEVRPVYDEACAGRHHHELIDPGPEPDGTGLVWP